MLSVMNDTSLRGAPVDWWFMYKFPHSQVKQKSSTPDDEGSILSGINYLYLDSDETGGLKLSPHLLGKAAGALYCTLDHIFSAAEKPHSKVGWVLYNDEIPDSNKNNQSKGHCKGILAFDKETDCGIWILHSTPRFPVIGNPAFPDNEHIYAQTFIGITLDSYDTACLIATQLHHQQQPQVYAYKLSDSAASAGEQDAIYRLCCGKGPHEGALTSHIVFKSRGGVEFQSIAKNRHWGKDFWIDLVGPALEADLRVETWRRGKIPGTEDIDQSHDVQDVIGIDLSQLGISIGWHYTHDHAKWATSEKKPAATEPGWVCIADINRQVSQEKRGGGSICFKEEELWKALSSIEVFS